MWAAGLRALARGARRSGSPHAEQLQQLRWLNIHEYQVQRALRCARPCFACLPSYAGRGLNADLQAYWILHCSWFGIFRSQLCIVHFLNVQTELCPLGLALHFHMCVMSCLLLTSSLHMSSAVIPQDSGPGTRVTCRNACWPEPAPVSCAT